MEGAHFCARLSAFKTLSLFFCNSTALGSIARTLRFRDLL